MKTFLVCVVLFLSAIALQAQGVSKEYEQAMIKMLEASRNMEAMKQIAPQMINMIKQQTKDVPDEAWKEIEAEMIAMYDQIIKAMIPIYQKYMTLEDIQEVIKFYETPVGKKMAEATPKITMESMPIAQKIAMENMQKLMEKLKGKGYIKQ